MKTGTVAPPCVKFHVEIPSAVKVRSGQARSIYRSPSLEIPMGSHLDLFGIVIMTPG